MSKVNPRAYTQTIGEYVLAYAVARRGFLQWDWEATISYHGVTTEAMMGTARTQLGAMFAANYAIAGAKRKLRLK